MTRELERLRQQVRINRLLLVGVAIAYVHCASTPAPPSAVATPSEPKADGVTFERITVGRIDVRDADGTLRMVLTNDDQAPGPVVDPERGEEADRVGGNAAGIVFYNEKGAENGALYIDGHDVGISIDRWQQDQTLVIGYGEDGSGYYSGMLVYERPDTPHVETLERVEALRSVEDPAARQAAMLEMQKAGAFGTYRMFVGKNEQGMAMIELADRRQRPRLQMSVDEQGEPHLRFLDEDGKTTYVVPPEPAKK